MADRAGFEEFVALRSPRLLRVCYLLTRDWAGAEDLLQTPAAAHDPTRDVDERDELWTALGRLPRRQRAVVVLRFFEDLTERQAADALGVSIGTVKSQTSRALATLRIDPGLRPAGISLDPREELS